MRQNYVGELLLVPNWEYNLGFSLATNLDILERNFLIMVYLPKSGKFKV